MIKCKRDVNISGTAASSSGWIPNSAKTQVLPHRREDLGGWVTYRSAAADSSRWFSDSALYGIIGSMHYYITIALRYAQKESRVGIIQLGLKRRLPTLPPK